MSDFFRIERAQLQSWADRVSAASEFPRLVRRLILETATEVVGLSFPAGEGVAAGGWDGSIRSGAATQFIPGGLSVWELSVREAVGTKADEDYRKRTAAPDGTPTTRPPMWPPPSGPGKSARHGRERGARKVGGRRCAPSASTT